MPNGSSESRSLVARVRLYTSLVENKQADYFYCDLLWKLDSGRQRIHNTWHSDKGLKQTAQELQTVIKPVQEQNGCIKCAVTR